MKNEKKHLNVNYRLRKYSAKRKRLRFKKIPKSLPAAHFEEEKNVSRTKHHYRLVDKDKQANNEDDKGIDDQSWGLNYKLKNEWKVYLFWKDSTYCRKFS